MIYIVWGYGTMYYLLSSRAADSDDNGSINLLIWTAIKRANERGLLLDLDGVISSGTARFLSGFGGRLKARWIARRTRLRYTILQLAKRRIIGGVADETLGVHMTNSPPLNQAREAAVWQLRTTRSILGLLGNHSPVRLPVEKIERHLFGREVVA